MRAASYPRSAPHAAAAHEPRHAAPKHAPQVVDVAVAVRPRAGRLAAEREVRRALQQLAGRAAATQLPVHLGQHTCQHARLQQQRRRLGPERGGVSQRGAATRLHVRAVCRGTVAAGKSARAMLCSSHRLGNQLPSRELFRFRANHKQTYNPHTGLQSGSYCGY